MRPRRRARAALLAGLSLVLLGACGLNAETPASPPGTPGTSRAPGTPENADRVPGAGRLGDSTRAYRFPAKGEERGGQTWVKEIRFGSYLLQVRLTAAFDTTPVRGFPRGTMASPVRGEELESYAASIFQHATRVTAARTPMPPPMPPPGGPSPSFSATGPAARDPRGLLGRVVLPKFQDLRPGGPVATRVTQDGPVDAAGQAWLAAYAVPGVTNPDCLPTAGGMWQAAVAEQVMGPRPWVAVRTLTGPGGFFVTETVVWWSTASRRGLERSPSALACGAFPHRGGTVRTKVIQTPPLGDTSRAFQVVTADGDAPTLAQWMWVGPYSIEVRVGTQGNRPSARVSEATLAAVSRAALERAKRNMP